MPEGVDREIAELQALMKKYNHGTAKPVWCTEYGWGTFNAGSYANIAKNLVGPACCCAFGKCRGCSGTCSAITRRSRRWAWCSYPLTLGQARAEPGRPGLRQHGMAAARLRGTRPARRSRRSASATCTASAGPGDRTCAVCWATYPATIVVEAAGGLTRCDLMGNESPVQPVDGRPRADAGRHAVLPAWPREAGEREAGPRADRRRFGRGILEPPGRQPLVLRLF